MPLDETPDPAAGMEPEGSADPQPPAVDAPARSFLRDLHTNLGGGLRALCLLTVRTEHFRAGGDAFIVLVALGLALNLLAAYASVGPEGYFNLQAMPSSAFGVLMLLLAGHVVARLRGDGPLALTIAVAVGAATLLLNVIANALWLAIDRGWIEQPQALGAFGLYYILFGWWAIASILAVTRLAGGRPLLPAAALALLVLLPGWFLPAQRLWEDVPDRQAGTGRDWYAAVGEEAYYSQQAWLDDALAGLQPGRPGVEDLYFIGFAPYAGQDVFMKEMQSVEAVVRSRFDVEGRTLSLISNPALVGKVPIATLTSLRQALHAVGSRMDPDEDVLWLHVTTHGSDRHQLSVDFWPLQLGAIAPADLRSALDDAGIGWRVVVVSACYSGGFMDALKDARTLVVTAADATHTSFGCSNESDYTYFSRAFYEEALGQTTVLPEAFGLAHASVRAREQKEGLEPSNPQIYAGEQIVAKLESLRRGLPKP
jgi:hypothetical protein